jgi:broad specificity phosphatase PhoE
MASFQIITMNNIPMPEISPEFTIDDIHKVREWQYEKYKGMTPEEICEDTRKDAERFLAELNSPRDPSYSG